MKDFLQGRKTMLGGVAVILAALVGVFFGVMTPEAALAIGGVGFAIVGIADKTNRHQAELLAVLQDVAKTGADYRAGNRDALAPDIMRIAGGGLKVAEGLGSPPVKVGELIPDGKVHEAKL